MILATYLAALGADEVLSGVVLGIALLSGAVLNIAASRWADRFGRRRFLALSGLLMFTSGLVLAFTGSLEGALVASLLGALTPTAMEVGPFLSVEQAVLPQASTAEGRTDAYAWYNLVGSLAAAVGALLSGLAATFAVLMGSDLIGGMHVMFGLYALAGLFSVAAAMALSPRVELSDAERSSPPEPLSAESRKSVNRLVGLFALDSFAGGMIIRTFTALWFTVRFAPDINTLGLVFFGANTLSAVSYLVAARLSRSLGLVKTMVYTHIPSNVLLIAMAFSPTFEVGVLLFLARMSLAQMDVAPRQQFVVSVVAPRERTAASGLTNTARNISQSAGPFVIGPVVGAMAIGGPFLLAGVLKIGYDIAMLRAFGRFPPPEKVGPEFAGK